ncbi:MAG: hypothetical protein Q8N26_38165 [Myxococcales bacterium]|nr:hypothetical protein [Myxococcales bacterium]
MAIPVSVGSEGAAALRRRLLSLEEAVSADVLGVFGIIRPGVERDIRDQLEIMASAKEKLRPRLAVVLTTPGGVVEVTERIVAVLRHFYGEVAFYIPDIAFSAGTVLAMSGDQIWMDYFSCLGPIDPQVERDGKYVPALSYLSQYDRLVAKAQAKTISEAEFLIMRGFDQAELHLFEKARDLSVSLLKGWLAQYKFKDWVQTESSKKQVTQQMREERAEAVAKLLMDHERWGSHGRGIGMKVLREKLNLRIDDFGEVKNLAPLLRDYATLAMDVMLRSNWHSMVSCRGDQ